MTIVSVTQHDIDTGKRGDPFGCPLILALKRAFDRPEGTYCLGVSAYLEGGRYGWRQGFAKKYRVYVSVPPEARAWGHNFDSLDPDMSRVVPFTFESEVV